MGMLCSKMNVTNCSVLRIVTLPVTWSIRILLSGLPKPKPYLKIRLYQGHFMCSLMTYPCTRSDFCLVCLLLKRRANPEFYSPPMVKKEYADLTCVALGIFLTPVNT